MRGYWRFPGRASACVGMLLALFGATHCGGKSEAPREAAAAPGRVPDPPPSVEASALAAAQCDYLERCDLDAMFLFPESARGACEEYFACAQPVPSFGKSEEFTLQGCLE